MKSFKQGLAAFIGGTLLALLTAASMHGQPAALTLQQAVRQAMDQYPAARAVDEQAAAAAAGIRLARSAYLPRADVLGQVNRATFNNTFGLLLPQSTIPSISGPVLGTNGVSNVWGSTAGVLVSWEPFDFGLRQTQVETAEAASRRAGTAAARARYEIGTTAADAFLTILAAGQMVRSARATVERARSVELIVAALTKADLRAGVDAERFRAERVLAETQLIQAEQAEKSARVALGGLLGIPASDISAAPGRLLEPPPVEEPAPAALATHPLAKEQHSAIEEIQARRKSLDRVYYPRFNLQAASYVRGSGANTDGSTGGFWSGLAPERQNWAVGLTVTFPLMELPSLRIRREIETHRQLAETARYEQVLQDLTSRMERAEAWLESAWRIARNAPVQMEAARAVEKQALARYQSGLATLIEVADAERLLSQSEIDHGLANLNVWRGMLAVAAARGNLDPLLALSQR